MKDPLYDAVISGLKQRKGAWPEISDKTGVSTKTMQRMVNGENNNRRDTILALAEHFKAHPVQPARAR